MAIIVIGFLVTYRYAGSIGHFYMQHLPSIRCTACRLGQWHTEYTRASAGHIGTGSPCTGHLARENTK